MACRQISLEMRHVCENEKRVCCVSLRALHGRAAGRLPVECWHELREWLVLALAERMYVSTRMTHELREKDRAERWRVRERSALFVVSLVSSGVVVGAPECLSSAGYYSGCQTQRVLSLV